MGFEADVELPEDFQGILPLFPLPNFVLFPFAMQPLHIFESRYRALLADALAGQRLIAMGRLSPGWQSDYEGAPPVEDHVCIGRIVSHAPQADGRSNILVLGLSRAVIQQELTTDLAYRQVEVELLHDQYHSDAAEQRAQLNRQLRDTFRRLLPSSPSAREQFEDLLSGDLPLGLLTDIVAFSLQLSLEFKQELLAQVDVAARARRLLETLVAELQQPTNPLQYRARLGFPPKFSDN